MDGQTIETQDATESIWERWRETYITYLFNLVVKAMFNVQQVHVCVLIYNVCVNIAVRLKADMSWYEPWICFIIKSISVHPILLLMNVMLDFICMVFTELCAMGSKRKIQKENMDSNQRPLHFQCAALTARLSLKPPGDCKLTLKYKATATVQPEKHTRNGFREYACT